MKLLVYNKRLIYLLIHKVLLINHDYSFLVHFDYLIINILIWVMVIIWYYLKILYNGYNIK